MMSLTTTLRKFGFANNVVVRSDKEKKRTSMKLVIKIVVVVFFKFLCLIYLTKTFRQYYLRATTLFFI